MSASMYGLAQRQNADAARVPSVAASSLYGGAPHSSAQVIRSRRWRRSWLYELRACLTAEAISATGARSNQSCRHAMPTNSSAPTNAPAPAACLSDACVHPRVPT
eukprot:3565300-Pleurochrysis_carterae.AAC.1